MSQPPNTSRKPLHIAIVGGGIGGLSCAVALKDCTNIRVDIYEAAAQITEIGAGVTVWPRTWEILKDMGMEEELAGRLKDAPDMDKPKIAFTFRKSDQAEEGFALLDLKMNGGALNFHRKDVQQALLQRVPSFCTIHLNHRLSKCSETDSAVQLQFSNGRSAECDLLIGADGVKSVVRRDLKGPQTSPIYSGTVAFRGLVPREKLEQAHPGHRALEQPIQYCGKDRHIVVYPISQNTIVNIVAFYSKPQDFGKPLTIPEVRDGTLEEVLKVYEGWEPEVQHLLQCIENPSCWVIQDLEPLESYVGNRTLLLGDAAHAMHPHLGAGAGQAIEDAWVLGGIVQASSRSGGDVSHIVQMYDALRTPFANYILTTARKQGTYYELGAPEFRDINEQGAVLSAEQKAVFAKTVQGNWAWATDSADDDRQKAVKIMNASLNKL
ncbi:hypothetical protein AAF712_004725 [Marasmius tenuissimus]|uniref:FAD-binding domain-containing protein n=1 Tax=Marasmius tenuissimus TaxID=585030 RepID=A0ABR3A3W8_9AGAR